MNSFGVAELLKRASSRIATVVDDEKSIFTQHIGETTGMVRHHLDDMVMLERSTEGSLWLPGWEDRENGAPLWFRADAVSHHMLHDFNGRENGISFDAKSEDRMRRSSWASARDLRGKREYEQVKDDDLTREEHDAGTRYYVDRSKVKAVPMPGYDPDHPTIQIAAHSGADDFGLKLNGHDENGEATERLIAVEGTSFGLLVAHTPGFQRLLTNNPDSNVTFGPSCGPARYSATAGQRAVDAMVANGMDRRVFASTGARMLAHSYNAEGTRVWDHQPEFSTLAITENKDKLGNLVPGEFVELRTPWFGS
ncbi:hypothetical protein AB0M34_00995 [Nocardia sp. NPDC050193]